MELARKSNKWNEFIMIWRIIREGTPCRRPGRPFKPLYSPPSTGFYRSVVGLTVGVPQFAHWMPSPKGAPGPLGQVTYWFINRIGQEADRSEDRSSVHSSYCRLSPGFGMSVKEANG